ncbi:MAG TPA: chromosomal replication initiator protein DnaA, partial [Limnochordales bacterium]
MPSWLEVWQEAVSLLARQEPLSPGFDNWLKRSRPLHVAGNRLVVQVPDPFTRDWVKTRYQRTLESCLTRLVGAPCSLELVLPGDPLPEALPGATPPPPPTERPGPAPEPPPAGPEERAGRGLNPRYTFDTFVVGNSNRFAYSACRGVVANPGTQYNPLFLYGGVGLGKTHLMQAVAHEFLRTRSGLRVLYLTTEEFTNELVEALQRKSMAAFRARYRSVDVLLLDDVHFVAGKESTQEEFFHTFNTLYEAGRQLVLSSDRPPGEIPRLEERLRSRFAWGLLADIQPPDFETRLAILRQRTREMGEQVADEVLLYIADQVRSNIRVLEGALRRVITAARLAGTAPSVELAARELAPLADSQRRPVTV